MDADFSFSRKATRSRLLDDGGCKIYTFMAIADLHREEDDGIEKKRERE